MAAGFHIGPGGHPAAGHPAHQPLVQTPPAFSVSRRQPLRNLHLQVAKIGIHQKQRGPLDGKAALHFP